MRNVFRRAAGQLYRSSAAGMVAGLVVAVTVVGATSAQFGVGPLAGPDTTFAESPEDTTVDSVPGSELTDSERLDEIDARLDGLDEQMMELSDDNEVLHRGLWEQEDALDALTRTVSAQAGDIASLQSSLKNARTALDTLADAVATLQESVSALQSKAAKLTAEGNYTGPVDPSQLSRKLTPADINGNWPLGRTTDTLDIKKLGTPTFGCYADSRYNTFVTVDTWGEYTCTRILK